MREINLGTSATVRLIEGVRLIQVSLYKHVLKKDEVIENSRLKMLAIRKFKRDSFYCKLNGIHFCINLTCRTNLCFDFYCHDTTYLRPIKL